MQERSTARWLLFKAWGRAKDRVGKIKRWASPPEGISTLCLLLKDPAQSMGSSEGTTLVSTLLTAASVSLHC